jgi:hypothetical protein
MVSGFVKFEDKGRSGRYISVIAAESAEPVAAAAS